MCLAAEDAEIPNMLIRVAIGMLTCVEDSQSSIAIIHNANDGEMDLDFSPIECNESENQNMIVLVVNKPGSGETFTEDMLHATKDLLGKKSSSLQDAAGFKASVSIKNAQRKQLTQAHLKQFLDSVQSIQYVVIYKVNELEVVDPFHASACQ